MARKRVTLDMWIREALLDTDKDAPLTMIACVHMVNQVEKDEVHAVRFGSKQWEVKDLAKLFMSKAEAFAQNIPGVQHFSLLAFYGNRDEPQAKHRFNVMGESEYDGMGSEGPTPQGMWAQGMRHLEASTQMMLKQTASILDASHRTIHALTEQNEKLMRENQDAVSLVKDIILSQQDRVHQHQMTQLTYQRSTQERRKWMTYAPALINSLLGREVFPQSSADTSLVESVALALSENDIKMLSQNLPPELWGPLADRLTSALRAQREDKMLEQEVSKTLETDAEADAAGD